MKFDGEILYEFLIRDFIHEQQWWTLIIMNSFMRSFSWLHMLHFMTYEYRYKFMYMKNITSSYMNQGGAKVPGASLELPESRLPRQWACQVEPRPWHGAVGGRMQRTTRGLGDSNSRLSTLSHSYWPARPGPRCSCWSWQYLTGTSKLQLEVAKA